MVVNEDEENFIVDVEGNYILIVINMDYGCVSVLVIVVVMDLVYEL